MNKRILFLIESLRSGGKERRLIELLMFLKKNTSYEIMVILTIDEIHYRYIDELMIPIRIIKRKWLRKDPLVFYKILKEAIKFKPHLIHSWGMLTTFYSIPSKILLNCRLISNLISDAKKGFKKWTFANLIFILNCYFSDIILSNSIAGLNAYGIKGNKSFVVYNGVRLDRFNISYDSIKKKELRIETPFVVLMVASTAPNKDYDLFLDVAKEVYQIRKDITFIGVGTGSEFERLRGRINDESIVNTILLGARIDVENIIAIADVGVLFSSSEGISNALIEYMAMSKPVITTDTIGGSNELIKNNITGFILDANINKIKATLIYIIDNEDIRIKMGKEAKQVINRLFTIEKMGSQYIKIYNQFIK